MSFHIRRHPARRQRGFTRYQLWFSSGMPVEFIIQSPPTPQTREWQVLFALEVRKALERWIETNAEEHHDFIWDGTEQRR